MLVMRMKPIPAVLVSVLSTAGLLAAAVPPEHVPAGADDLLAEIRSAEAFLGGDFTVEFEMRRPAIRRDPDQGERVFSVRATRQGESFAMHAHTSYDAPRYRPVDAPGYQEIDFDPDGNLWLWRVSEVSVFSSPELNASVSDLLLLTISPEGRIIAQESNRQHTQYGIGDRDNVFLFNQFLLAAGRDYSRHLDTVIKSAVQEDGMVGVQVAGTHGSAPPGTWDLVIDPANSNLVRFASFERRPGSPVLEVTTEGEIHADGNRRHILAEKGTLVFPRGGRGRPYTVHVKTLSLTLEPDEELLAEVRANVTAPPAAGSPVVDFRGAQPAITVAGSSED